MSQKSVSPRVQGKKATGSLGTLIHRGRAVTVFRELVKDQPTSVKLMRGGTECRWTDSSREIRVSGDKLEEKLGIAVSGSNVGDILVIDEPRLSIDITDKGIDISKVILFPGDLGTWAVRQLLVSPNITPCTRTLTDLGLFESDYKGRADLRPLSGSPPLWQCRSRLEVKTVRVRTVRDIIKRGDFECEGVFSLGLGRWGSVLDPETGEWFAYESEEEAFMGLMRDRYPGTRLNLSDWVVEYGIENQGINA